MDAPCDPHFGPRPARELLALIAGNDKLRQSMEGKLLTNALAVQIGAANQANELADFLSIMDRLPASDGRELMASLMSKLPAKARDRIKSAGKSGELFKQLVSDAVTTARDEKQGVPERVAAVRTLGLAEFASVKGNFAEFLKFRQPELVQKGALETLTRFEHADAATLVIDAWPSLSPQVRTTAAETLFAAHRSTRSWMPSKRHDQDRRDRSGASNYYKRFPTRRFAAEPKALQGTQLCNERTVAAYQKSLDLKGTRPRARRYSKRTVRHAIVLTRRRQIAR